MNKSLLAVLAASALCSSWMAQAEENYVKFGIGQGHYKLDGRSSDETGASLAFGQSLTENWGWEIGYLTAGKWSGSSTSGGVKQSLSLRTQSLYAALVGTLPLNDSFSVYGKLGLAADYTKANARLTTNAVPPVTTRVSDSDTKYKPMIGIGAAYNFSKELAGTVEYQHFGKVGNDLKLSAWTVGLKYGF